MPVWVNIGLSHCPVGPYTGWTNVCWASVRGLLSGQVTVFLGSCPVDYVIMSFAIHT